MRKSLLALLGAGILVLTGCNYPSYNLKQDYTPKYTAQSYVNSKAKGSPENFSNLKTNDLSNYNPQAEGNSVLREKSLQTSVKPLRDGLVIEQNPFAVNRNNSNLESKAEDTISISYEELQRTAPEEARIISTLSEEYKKIIKEEFAIRGINNSEDAKRRITEYWYDKEGLTFVLNKKEHGKRITIPYLTTRSLTFSTPFWQEIYAQFGIAPFSKDTNYPYLQKLRDKTASLDGGPFGYSPSNDFFWLLIGAYTEDINIEGLADGINGWIKFAKDRHLNFSKENLKEAGEAAWNGVKEKVAEKIR